MARVPGLDPGSRGFESLHLDSMTLQQSINDQIVNVAHIQRVVADCSDLVNRLEAALDSAEVVCPEEHLQEMAERIAAISARKSINA